MFGDAKFVFCKLAFLKVFLSATDRVLTCGGVAFLRRGHPLREVSVAFKNPKECGVLEFGASLRNNRFFA